KSRLVTTDSGLAAKIDQTISPLERILRGVKWNITDDEFNVKVAGNGIGRGPHIKSPTREHDHGRESREGTPGARHSQHACDLDVIVGGFGWQLENLAGGNDERVGEIDPSWYEFRSKPNAIRVHLDVHGHCHISMR